MMGDTGDISFSSIVFTVAATESAVGIVMDFFTFLTGLFEIFNFFFDELFFGFLNNDFLGGFGIGIGIGMFGGLRLCVRMFLCHAPAFLCVSLVEGEN